MGKHRWGNVKFANLAKNPPKTGLTGVTKLTGYILTNDFKTSTRFGPL